MFQNVNPPRPPGHVLLTHTRTPTVAEAAHRMLVLPENRHAKNLLLRAVLVAVGLHLQLLRIRLGLYLRHVETPRQNFLNSTAS